MRSASLVLVSAISALAASGCSSTVARPNWLNPGPVNYQQNQALRYDPYPDDSLGPAVLGGRPREYDRPRPPAPLVVHPAVGAMGGAAPPVGLAPTPGPYSPGPLTPAPMYPQTPYSQPVYAPAPSAAPVAPGPVSP